MSVSTPGQTTNTVPPWENANEFLPKGVAADFIGVIEEESMALRLGRRLRMSAAQESIPIVAFRPQAKFVSPAYGGRKPVTEVRWSAVEIRPEEVAAVVPVPNAWIADADFDVEGQVERELANAVAYAIDQAIIFGNDAPASYPPGGVVGFADTVSGDDAVGAISEAMGNLEGKGIMPDGIASGAAIGAALRQAYIAVEGDFATAPVQTLWGLTIARSLAWTPPPDAIVGGWNYLAIGVREDVTFGRSVDGVLLDDDGAIIASAFQDNVTLIKVYARIGCAIGMPSRAVPGQAEPQKPFAAAQWSGGGGTGGGGNGAEGLSAQQQQTRGGEPTDPAAARRRRS